MFFVKKLFGLLPALLGVDHLYTGARHERVWSSTPVKQAKRGNACNPAGTKLLKKAQRNQLGIARIK